MSFLNPIIFVIALLLTACGSTKKELTDVERKAELYYSRGTQLLIEKHYTEALMLSPKPMTLPLTTLEFSTILEWLTISRVNWCWLNNILQSLLN